MSFQKFACVAAILFGLVVLSSQTDESVELVPAGERVPVAESAATVEPTAAPEAGAAGEAAAPVEAPVATGTEPAAVALDLRELDYSAARVSLAGPAALYFRNVKKQGVPLALLFKRDATGVWNLAETSPDADNVFPEGTVFDFAQIESAEDGALVINGVLVDGQGQKARLSLQGASSFRMETGLQAGELIGSSLERLRNSARLAYKGEIDELDQTRRLNQELLGKIGSMDEADKPDQNAEILELKDQIAQLGARNQSLNTELEGLKAELDKVKTENQGLAARADKPVEPGQPADKGDIQVLDSSLKDLGKKVDNLSESIEKTRGQLSEAPAAGNSDVEALRAEIKRLSEANEAFMAERNRLEQQIRDGFLRNGYLATMKPQLKTKVLEGFANAKGRIGTWKFDGATARQTDPDQYFAQMDIPLVQDGKTMLYHFKARSGGKAWVGLGLHIVASGGEKNGYGNGESLLVWLTRDKEYYRNNNTYLQLYRSDDDINMGRVLDAAIQEPISSDLDVEVLYQPKEEYITIAVNGVEKIRYKTWFGRNKGVEVSLRTLDTAVFSGLEVWSE